MPDIQQWIFKWNIENCINVTAILVLNLSVKYCVKIILFILLWYWLKKIIDLDT